MSALMAQLRLPRIMPDRALLVAIGVLLFIGLVMVASSSVDKADQLTGEPLYFFNRQAIYALLGLLLAFGVIHVPMRVWQAQSVVLLIIGAGLALAVLLPGIGHAVNGARRWLELGPFTVQASEPARLFALMFVAAYASRQQLALTTTWGGLIRPLLVVMIIGAMLLMEPNYGATAVLVIVAGMMLFIAGARLVPLCSLATIGIGLLTFFAMSSPYRMARLTSFADPWADPFGSGFQLVQSLIAVGHGGIFGVGLGNSVQKLLYLPETHTDFLFAIFAEEFGLVGVCIIIALFLVILWRAFVLARRAVDAGQLFNGFLAYGLAGWLVLQAFINMGVNLGALPTKGLTLPLMSYGGSSIVTSCILLGLLLRVDIESRMPDGGRGT